MNICFDQASNIFAWKIFRLTSLFKYKYGIHSFNFLFIRFKNHFLMSTAYNNPKLIGNGNIKKLYYKFNHVISNTWSDKQLSKLFGEKLEKIEYSYSHKLRPIFYLDMPGNKTIVYSYCLTLAYLISNWRINKQQIEFTCFTIINVSNFFGR